MGNNTVKLKVPKDNSHISAGNWELVRLMATKKKSVKEPLYIKSHTCSIFKRASVVQVVKAVGH